MSVKVRPYVTGGLEVDIRFEYPDGTRVRMRRKAPVSTRAAALRWGADRERELILQGPKKPRKEVPTLSEFAPRYVEGHLMADRQKPSTIASAKTILRIHLIPFLGPKKLDAIWDEDIQRLKTKLSDRSPKTVNNILSVLNRLLRSAVEWGALDHKSCNIRVLPVQSQDAAFHDFAEFGRLVEAAMGLSRQAHLIVLLGGEAGLRCGEMMALEWTDVDFDRGRLRVQRSDWKGHVTAPKGGKSRTIPLTGRLASALAAHRHLRGQRVLTTAEGKPLTQKVVQVLVRNAARRANLALSGVHALRHTFCSHLAMRGAPARAIQELAGHKDLATTLRYMHLSPAVVEGAIRLLDQPAPFSRSQVHASGTEERGEIVEAAGTVKLNP